MTSIVGCLRWTRQGRVSKHRVPKLVVEQVLGAREVDCAVDCVGFEAKGRGGEEQPPSRPTG